MKVFFASLVCLLVSSISFAQYTKSLGVIFDEPTVQLVKKWPYVSGDSAHFAYVQYSGAIQYLRLAQMTEAYPESKAEFLRTLTSYDTSDVYPGVVEKIVDMSASPDNRYLLVYSLQEGYFSSESFFDHNIKIYDMVTGDLIGSTNEHSFASIDRSNAYSQVYEDYIIAIGATPEDSMNWTYTVETEGVIAGSPDWQWNEDGTLTIEMTLDVLESFADGAYVDYIGPDVFYHTFTISPTGLSSEGFGPPRSAASYPSLFSLTPVSGTEDVIKFQGKSVKFPYRLSFRFGKSKYFERSKLATMVEGSIPKRYRYYNYFDFVSF